MRFGVGFGVLLVAGGAAYLLPQGDHKTPSQLVSTPSCAPSQAPPASARPVALPQPQQVRLALLNGTARDRLAKSVGDELAARGFVITAQGNASAALTGPSQVLWGPGAQPSAQLLLRYVIGSRAVNNPRAPRGSLQVVLGSEFHRLATPAEVAKLAASTLPAAGTTPSPTAAACLS